MTATEIIGAVAGVIIAVTGFLGGIVALRRVLTESEMRQDEVYQRLVDSLERRVDTLDRRDEQRDRELDKVYGRLSVLERENQSLKRENELMGRKLSVAIGYIGTLVGLLTKVEVDPPSPPGDLQGWMDDNGGDV